jgi:hypothetical protein
VSLLFQVPQEPFALLGTIFQDEPHQLAGCINEPKGPLQLGLVNTSSGTGDQEDEQLEGLILRQDPTLAHGSHLSILLCEDDLLERQPGGRLELFIGVPQGDNELRLDILRYVVGFYVLNAL